MQILSLLLLAVAHGAAAQAPDKPTLSQYLQKHPWDAAKSGPMLVVNPDGVTTSTNDEGLGAFNRQEIGCGQLTVIAPTEMVIIDAGLQDQPNLYEGLQLSDRVLYLMKSLTPEQWQIAGKSGIGLSDLQGEQKAVFNSIVPKPFVVTHDIVDSDNSWLNGNEKEQLTPEQAAEVKLRFFRSISMGVSLQGGRGYTSFGSWAGKDHAKGDKILMLDKSDPDETDTLFGVKVRKTLPNTEKPSQLDYRSSKLNTLVKVPGTTKLSDLVQAASQATGLKIMADFRVGNLNVSCYGSQVNARDLLRGLARAVTSTYRRVGDRYLLASDIAGIGSRRLTIAMWKEQIQEEVKKRENEWKAEVGKSKGANFVAYNAADELAPNDAMKQWMDAHSDPWNTSYMPVTDMSPLWQEKMQQHADASKTNSTPLDGTRGDPTAMICCNFVLPDGRTVDGSLLGFAVGDLRTAQEWNWKLQPNPEVKPITLAGGSQTSIAVRADTPEIADVAVSTAALYGFSELWLESADAQTIQEALTKARDIGITIRLLVRPWEAPKGGRIEDPELTIFGDEPAQAQARMATMPSWEEVTEFMKDPPDPANPLISPLDPFMEPQWMAIVRMSKMAGLAGTVICDSQPDGYEPEHKNVTYGGWGRPISDAGHLGYSLQQRLAFLDKYSLDPIDIADMRLDLRQNLNPPFYTGPRLVDGRVANDSEPYGGAEKLLEMLSTDNKVAVAQLLSMLPAPTLVQRRRLISDVPPSPVDWIEPWGPGQNMPTAEGDDEDTPGPSGSVCMVKVGFPMTARMAAGTWQRISDHLTANKSPVAIDFTGVPTQQIGVILRAWFASKTS